MAGPDYAAEFERAQQLYDAHAEDAILLVPEQPDHARSRSHIGGLPCLPKGMDWPREEGYRLPFLAGLDLSELPQQGRSEGLPQTGWLWVFADIDDSCTDCHVVFAEQSGPQTAPPKGLAPLPDYLKTMDHPGVLKRTTMRSIPARVVADFWALREIGAMRTTAPSDVQTQAYEDALAKAEPQRQQTLAPLLEYQVHLVGGPKMYGINHEGGEGIQLLHLESNFVQLGLSIGDCGDLSVWIDPDDAKAGRWDRATMTSGSC